ncbi:hypothetical protein NSU02_08040 [Aeribacillus sp. FSL W8-0870]|uniref:hypothetical protein n=1 Tax=Aeribacillus sp. FSL W8-0870 TaxID=2954706 RepID=UPI0030D0643D
MNVLEQDRELAEKLWGCGCINLDRARVAWVNGQFDEAERWVDEFKRCKSDLDKLVGRKKEHDRLVQVVRDMQKKGVDLTIVERRSYK